MLIRATALVLLCTPLTCAAEERIAYLPDGRAVYIDVPTPPPQRTVIVQPPQPDPQAAAIGRMLDNAERIRAEALQQRQAEQQAAADAAAERRRQAALAQRHAEVVAADKWAAAHPMTKETHICTRVENGVKVFEDCAKQSAITVDRSKSKD